MKTTSSALLLVLFSVFTVSKTVYAQSEKPKISIGFQLQQLTDDFGIGLHAAFPIYKNAVFLRTAVAHNWLEHYVPADDETTWTGYQNFRIGLGGRYPVSERVFCYSEGGLFVVRSPEELSSKRTGFGGYGLFGFEFMFAPSSGYFLEAGGNGVQMESDNIPGKPSLANGFMLNVGYRVKF